MELQTRSNLFCIHVQLRVGYVKKKVSLREFYVYHLSHLCAWRQKNPDSKDCCDGLSQKIMTLLELAESSVSTLVCLPQDSIDLS